MRKISFSIIPILVVSIAINACNSNNTTAINQIQVIGSHNSYKKAIAPALFEYLKKEDTTNSIQSLAYDHIPILEQLDLGLRNLEIDVYIDEEGGKFSDPKGLELVPQEEFDSKKELNQPGFKILHIPDIDFRSHYYLLKTCLQDLKKWSEEHPDHSPVFITLEPKDGAASAFGTAPVQFTSRHFDELDHALVQFLGKEHLIIPDEVRGDYKTLNEAVLSGNWPGIEASKGKFLFILDAKPAKIKIYTENHASLKNRKIFTNSVEGSPEAATMIINDAHDASISALVEKGYLIRTRADANTTEARNNDYSTFEAAKKSGAQIITTDYYIPSTFFKSNYHIDFGENNFYRKNPINNKS